MCVKRCYRSAINSFHLTVRHQKRPLPVSLELGTVFFYENDPILTLCGTISQRAVLIGLGLNACFSFYYKLPWVQQLNTL